MVSSSFFSSEAMPRQVSPEKVQVSYSVGKKDDGSISLANKPGTRGGLAVERHVDVITHTGSVAALLV